MTHVILVIPPGVGLLAAHHEATSGMGSLAPRPDTFLYAPHTVAACAGVARAAGWRVTVLDGGHESDPVAFARRVAAQRADVLALLVSEGTRWSDGNFLHQLAHIYTQVDTPAPPRLLFGPSAHFVVDGWLAAGLAEAALAGEPEAALAHAMAGLAEGRVTGRIAAADLCPGSYLPSGLLADLDPLPFPAWDLTPWQPYREASLLSSRGCPAACTYCAYVVSQGRQFRRQSVARTLAEWEWLVRQVQPPYIMVRDPVFAHDRDRVAALCEGIIKAGLRHRWMCESRPEHFDASLLRLMAAAGCFAVKIGMESGDPALLAGLGRIARPEDAADHLARVRRVLADCRAAGITGMAFVMAGVPGQTSASLALTAAALRQLPADATVQAKPYQAHPGTSLAGAGASVARGTLDALQFGHHRASSPWRRAWRAVARRTRRLLHPSVPTPAAQPAVQTVVRDDDNMLPSPLFESFMGLRVFLTGGNGFIGGHIAAALVAAGAQVAALVRADSPLGQLADLPAEIVEGDLLQPPSWAAALDGCTLCFHVAALYAGPDQAERMYAVNVGGTSALLAACVAAHVRRVVYTSTIGAVGRLDGPHVVSNPSSGADPDENVPFNLWDGASHYVRSKFIAETLALSWQAAGQDIVIVKPTAPVGAWDTRPSATGRRILAALAGQPLPYPPGGINHAPIRDIAAGHLLAAQRGRPGASYILGHARGNLDEAAFLQMVARAAGLSSALPAPGWRPSGGPEALTANPARAIRELGLPQSDLAAAFEEAVAWYQAAARRLSQRKAE